jgi:hypothetical protein
MERFEIPYGDSVIKQSASPIQPGLLTEIFVVVVTVAVDVDDDSFAALDGAFGVVVKLIDFLM